MRASACHEVVEQDGSYRHPESASAGRGEGNKHTHNTVMLVVPVPATHLGRNFGSCYGSKRRPGVARRDVSFPSGMWITTDHAPFHMSPPAAATIHRRYFTVLSPTAGATPGSWVTAGGASCNGLRRVALRASGPEADGGKRRTRSPYSQRDVESCQIGRAHV